MENMYVLEYETEEETQRAYQELKKNDKIEYIVPDQKYETKNDIDEKIIYYKDINGEIFASWAGTSMGLDVLQDKINQKTEVPTITIAVLDSGLDLNHIVITEKYLSNISENGTQATVQNPACRQSKLRQDHYIQHTVRNAREGRKLFRSNGG